nr:LacI family DNA-binding transcriptional regulator [Roseibium denhamense]
MRRQRVTINDVASELGMTKSTVSRALNDYPDISDSTRLRVREAARTLGYRPLANAQAIRTGRLRAIGLVLQLNEHDRHRPFLADFLAGISQAASAAGWTVTVSTATSDEDTLRLLSNLAQEHKADGFILPRTLWQDPRIEFLRETDIPFVLYGRTGKPDGCAWFDITSEAAAEDAVKCLYDLGHRRIGFIPGEMKYTHARLKLEGYKAGLKACGLAYDPDLVSAAALNRRQGAATAEQLLSQRCPPTALVCTVDRAAIGAYLAADRFGLKVGSDLSIISYDGIEEGEYQTPPLTTFSANVADAGERLTHLLIKRINGAAPESLRELSPASFVARGSHGPVRKTPAELADIISIANHQVEE